MRFKFLSCPETEVITFVISDIRTNVFVFKTDIILFIIQAPRIFSTLIAYAEYIEVVIWNDRKEFIPVI